MIQVISNSSHNCRWIVTMWVLLLTSSCQKLVEVPPPISSLNEGIVFESDATAAAAITGIYMSLSKNNLINGNFIDGPGLTSLSLLAALGADEISLSNTNNELLNGFYKNALLSGETRFTSIWSTTYNILYAANSAINGLTNSTLLTAGVRRQLLGEAHFIRAFCYFYLVNLYGDVPLVINTDYKINSNISRTEKSKVWAQVIADLQEAKELLTDSYVGPDAFAVYPTGGEERVRPNKWTAIALLARTYLYIGEWAKAEAEATFVINNTALYELTPLADAFLKNSREAIWQLQPVNPNWNTEDAKVFVIRESGPTADQPVYVSDYLLNNFETEDQRKQLWLGKYTDTSATPDIDYFYPYKYKVADFASPLTEYQMVLRLGEQYLIRAEARAQLGNISGAQDDLNVIRARASLPNTVADNQNDLLDAIFHERQTELFTEWGHRWLDLKRSGRIDNVMANVTSAKGGSWISHWQWYPISALELRKNANLVQNQGY